MSVTGVTGVTGGALHPKSLILKGRYGRYGLSRAYVRNTRIIIAKIRPASCMHPRAYARSPVTPVTSVTPTKNQGFRTLRGKLLRVTPVTTRVTEAQSL